MSIPTPGVGALRERIPGGGAGASTVPGVRVEVGEKQAAVDLGIVVEHGASIVEPAGTVRRNAITAVERMTGLEVIEVDIDVAGVDVRVADVAVAEVAVAEVAVAEVAVAGGATAP